MTLIFKNKYITGPYPVAGNFRHPYYSNIYIYIYICVCVCVCVVEEVQSIIVWMNIESYCVK